MVEVLKLVGLYDKRKQSLGSLSLGEGQRTGLAIVLLGNPQFTVFDEPMNGLDPAGIRFLRRLIRQLADKGKTVLFSPHVLSDVEEIADEVVILKNGKVAAKDPLNVVKQDLDSLEELFFELRKGASVLIRNVLVEEARIPSVKASRLMIVAILFLQPLAGLLEAKSIKSIGLDAMPATYPSLNVNLIIVSFCEHCINILSDHTERQASTMGNAKKQRSFRMYKLRKPGSSDPTILPSDVKKRTRFKMDNRKCNVSDDNYRHPVKNLKSINQNNIDTIVDAAIEQNLEAIKDLVDL
ncbi:hypothetical protein RV10_GL001172 [Enterococcus pallens]|nr:hypothetical protein RV10_GL001172 [Enterococcus pallens]